MAKRRTPRMKRAEWDAAENRAWKDFEPKLIAAKNLAEAKKLVSNAPRPDSPGRKFYSNLGFFLGSLLVPNGSKPKEMKLYIGVIEKLVKNGELKPDVAQKAIDRLKEAISAQGDR